MALSVLKLTKKVFNNKKKSCPLFYATHAWLNTVSKNYSHQAMLGHLVLVSNDGFDNGPGKTYTYLLLLLLMSRKARAYKRNQTTIEILCKILFSQLSAHNYVHYLYSFIFPYIQR
jgi:hypothetical protein